MALPPEAASWRGEVWTREESFLVVLAERVDAWGRAHANLLVGKKASIPGPLQIPRPGEPKKKKAASLAELGQFFAAANPKAVRRVH